MTAVAGLPTGTSARNAPERIRRHIVRMCSGPEGGHLGGSMSIVEILTALYFNVMNVDPSRLDDSERDIFLLSKGHGAIGLYAALAERGYFDPAELDSFGTPGTRLMGHPVKAVPGVELPTGSLGHGLPLGAGFATAARLARSDRRTFVLLGDGELQEGSVWESALNCATRGLDNLVAIIDRNRLQLTGETEEITSLEPLADKWASFGWAVREVDGHDVTALTDLLAKTPWQEGRPGVLIAHTVKGQGVPGLAGRVQSHFLAMSERQAARAMAALSTKDGSHG